MPTALITALFLAGWTPGPTLALPAARLIRLQLGDSRILWQGAAGPGELRLYTTEPAPLPTPPGPTPAPAPSQVPPITFDAFLGQEGAVRTTFVVREPIRIRGHGFGNTPGALFINGFRRPVSRWTDTELVTTFDGANRWHPVWLSIRTAAGKSYATNGGPEGLFWVVRPDQLPAGK
jgi:hypothetical protein